MEGLDWLQWPAMAVTVGATWFTASRDSRRRKLGFAGFLLSNVLWIAWGWVDGAWALVCLQFCLAVLNIRGTRKNALEEQRQQAQGTADAPAQASGRGSATPA